MNYQEYRTGLIKKYPQFLFSRRVIKKIKRENVDLDKLVKLEGEEFHNAYLQLIS